MGTSHIFCIRNKRTNLFKVVLWILALYSMYVLLQIKIIIKQRQQTIPSSEDNAGMLENKKLQLDLLSNHNQRLQVREVNKENYVNTIKEVGKDLKIASEEALSMNVKIDVSVNGMSTNGKTRRIWNSTWPGGIDAFWQSAEGSNELQAKAGSVKQNIEHKKEEITSKRKYIFTLRYYEQLAGATKNLIDLASLAKHYNREVVMPFINNSRMNGIQDKPELRANTVLFNNLSRYFDITHFNSTLCERGYAPLTEFNAFIKDCRQGLDVLAHFIYNDSFSYTDAKNWFGIASKPWHELRKNMPEYGGVQSCDFLRKSGIERLLGGVTVKKYLCVDPEIIRTAEQIENEVFKRKSCIGILQWKGIGKRRTHFPLPESIFQILKPSDVVHNETLVSIAKDFVRRFLKHPFLAVHIRAERQLSWYGIDKVLKCMNILSKKVFQRMKAFQIESIFLSTDLPTYGSDTYKNVVYHDRGVVQRRLDKLLKNPSTFKPELYGVFDKGDISLIEMNILSFGESLYTIGGGKFQQWVVELFLAHNTEDHSLLHRVCLERLD